MKHKISGILTAGALFAVSAVSMAGTVTCPPNSSYFGAGTRYISTTTTNGPGESCLAFGTGNIPSSGNVTLVEGTTVGPYTVTYVDPGNTLVLDSFLGTYDVSAGTGLSGYLTFSGGLITLSSAFTGYTDLQLLIKTGNGQYNPDWAVFNLSGGDLTILAGVSPIQGGGISHISIFGTPTNVPEPATLGLLGLGLLGVGLARRRKAS